MFPDHLIIDFDSTFITKESLDELACFSLGEHPEKKGRLEKISSLTEAGMVGEITFDESLSQRMALLDADRRDVEFVTSQLMNAITPSFAKQIDFLQKHNESVWIISGGFREMIIPIVSSYGISPAQVFANDFIYGEDEKILGVDSENPMAQAGGKVIQVNAMGLKGEIHVIGDGLTDYELKGKGPASRFYAFIENVRRENVCELADGILNSFNDYIRLVRD